MKKILLSMLVILMATGCTFTLNGKTEEENKDNTIENETYESLSIDDSLVTELYNKINYFSITGPAGYNFSGYFYQKDSITVDDMDNKAKIFLALNNAETTSDELEQTLFVSDSSMKQAIEDLFGNVDYKNESLSTPIGCGFSRAYYDESKKQYSIGVACGGTGFPYYKTKLIQARKYENKIEIYEKHLAIKIEQLVKENGYDVPKYSIYKKFVRNGKDCTEYECLVGNDTIAENVDLTEEQLENYMGKADTYKYTFKLENGKYHFYSAEKVK